MMQADMPRLVLASASMARRALLDAAGLRFEALPAAVDEAAIKQAAQAEDIPAADTAMMLADAKAERIARRDPEALVIGCDQLLVCDGRWYDKPPDISAARTQLLELRGRTHDLVTAVVCHRHGARVWQHLARPRMTMRQFSDAFLDAYLTAEGDRVLGSVGAYRLEGPGVQLFARIQGDQAAILGLPLMELLGFLRQHGVLPD
ncbi:Maf family protein [Roseomonas fluvialis]|uniref:Nucleoside triphosphate pyrophosphatase n=1 Tax=Roseomonas fluvialis TaxID=1750527 RepID=A0ABN6PCY7_9PROT|nr:Maf family protein [Roseomonas fluvialis]BDG75203.1 Maf-like protein [Roseomonas fluvialis]